MVKIIKKIFKVSGNFPEGIQQMENRSEKSTKSFGRNTRVYGISATTHSITSPMLWKSTWYREGNRSSLLPQLPSWGYNFILGGAGCQYFSPLPPHQLQFQLAIRRTRLTLPHLIPIHRVETLSQVWQALNPGSIIFSSPVVSSGIGSTPEGASWGDQRQPCSAALLWCWSSA